MTVGIVVAGFGILAIPTIGFPFLVVGFLLLVGGTTDAPGRWPGVYWPTLAAVGMFFVGFVLVAPMWCSTEDVAVEADTAEGGTPTTSDPGTTCRSLTGIDYTGGFDDPPLGPGLATGVAAGILAALTARKLGATR